ncbi:unnamed protein product [Brugia pahangi]|uniref:Zinc finger, CCHC-type n=1 Tax=Brugia pahangi TaxID=6280 RepID=A0A0N4TRF3_BRUPA|nr:unnamed protein product [Brugia pahangi]
MLSPIGYGVSSARFLTVETKVEYWYCRYNGKYIRPKMMINEKYLQVRTVDIKTQKADGDIADGAPSIGNLITSRGRNNERLYKPKCSANRLGELGLGPIDCGICEEGPSEEEPTGGQTHLKKAYSTDSQ